jgi:choice-of-anchor A domain-containing protein
VYCDANCNSVFDTGDTPLAGITVNAYLCGTTTLVGSLLTGPDGTYKFEPTTTMPVGGTYEICVMIPAGFIGGPGVSCSSTCLAFEFPCNCGNDFPLCPTSGTCAPPCTNCVDPALGLGAATGNSVLDLGAAQVSINGPAGGVIGNVSIAAGGKANFSGGGEYLTGNVYLGPGATYQNSGTKLSGSVFYNQDLSAQIAAAYAANLSAASMPCTQTFSVLDGKTVTTIVAGPGINVICVHNITLSGKQILLTGDPSAKFIFNITGQFVLTGGGSGPQIRVDTSAGLSPSAVLYNLVGSGQDVAFSGGGGGVNCCAAVVDGTILAPYRKIALSPGLVNGEIISGKDISIVSGSSVRCPPCP